MCLALIETGYEWVKQIGLVDSTAAPVVSPGSLHFDPDRRATLVGDEQITALRATRSSWLGILDFTLRRYAIFQQQRGESL